MHKQSIHNKNRKDMSSLSTMKQISIFHKIPASISSLEYKYCRLKSKLHPISLCQLSFSSLNFIFCNFSPKCSHLLLARSFPSKTIKSLPLEPARSRGFEVRGFHLSFYLPTLSFPSRLVWQSKVTPRVAFFS